jgi:hypothetical protein
MARKVAFASIAERRAKTCKERNEKPKKVSMLINSTLTKYYRAHLHTKGS